MFRMYWIWATTYAVFTKAVAIKYTATCEICYSHDSMKNAAFWFVTSRTAVEIQILGGTLCLCS